MLTQPRLVSEALADAAAAVLACAFTGATLLSGTGNALRRWRIRKEIEAGSMSHEHLYARFIDAGGTDSEWEDLIGL